MTGVRRGDSLLLELIALEANDSRSIGQLLATVASAGVGRGEDPVQTTIPVGGVVRITARQPGGLIQFGPVVARRNPTGDPRGKPVVARMMVRCTLVQSHGV